MSDVSPIQQSHVPALDPKVRPSRQQTQTDTTTRGEDRVQLSDKAQFLSKIAELPDVRQDLVARVQSAIADGSYETSDKLDAAISNLVEDLA